MRQNRAAVKIQSAFRGHRDRKYCRDIRQVHLYWPRVYGYTCTVHPLHDNVSRKFGPVNVANRLILDLSLESYLIHAFVRLLFSFTKCCTENISTIGSFPRFLATTSGAGSLWPDIWRPHASLASSNETCDCFNSLSSYIMLPAACTRVSLFCIVESKLQHMQLRLDNCEFPYGDIVYQMSACVSEIF